MAWTRPQTAELVFFHWSLPHAVHHPLPHLSSQYFLSSSSGPSFLFPSALFLSLFFFSSYSAPLLLLLSLSTGISLSRYQLYVGIPCVSISVYTRLVPVQPVTIMGYGTEILNHDWFISSSTLLNCPISIPVLGWVGTVPMWLDIPCVSTLPYQPLWVQLVEGRTEQKR